MLRIDHLHVKTLEPATAADWCVRALGFRIVADETFPAGDRVVRCRSGDDALTVLFSTARPGQTLGAAATGWHYGLEHLGLASDGIDADVARLVGLGATLVEGPRQTRPGLRVAFLDIPGDVRIELLQRS